MNKTNSVMGLQSRKLNLIAYLAQIQDERILKEMESLIVKEQSKNTKNELKPFTIDRLIDRIEKSEQDFKDGKYKSQEELEKISEKW